MKSPVIFTDQNKTAKEAANIMIREEIGALPVLSNNKLVGIVSRTDLLNTIPR